jgi:hypothetical protein
MDALKNAVQAIWLIKGSTPTENKETEQPAATNTDYRSEEMAKHA